MKNTKAEQVMVGDKIVECDCEIRMVRAVRTMADGRIQIAVQSFSLRTDDYTGRVMYLPSFAPTDLVELF